jgi:hypothetical protein
MVRISLSVLAALLSSCAHVARRPAAGSPNEELIARAVWWATRVPEPAAEYRVELPSLVAAEPVLRKAAQYADLEVAGPGVLRRSSVKTPDALVHLAVASPEWVTPAEVLVPFSHARGVSEATACAVRIRIPTPEPDSWTYRAEGLEQCWPRPSRKL